MSSLVPVVCKYNPRLVSCNAIELTISPACTEVPLSETICGGVLPSDVAALVLPIGSVITPETAIMSNILSVFGFIMSPLIIFCLEQVCCFWALLSKMILL